jgi:GNAT superfamily N-acetyltransferase
VTIGRRLTFLIDTNVFLTLEPFGSGASSEPFNEAAAFSRRVHEHGHRIALHTGTREDIGRDHDVERGAQHLKALEKYVVLSDVPPSPALLAASSGGSENDRVDALIASALEANAVDYLVTEDKGLRSRVGRAAPALERRVLGLAEAVELLEQLHPLAPEPPPLVEKRPCYALSLDDPIFGSIRDDYNGFDRWFTDNCQRGHREAFVIDGGDSLAGICILKDEDEEEYGLPSNRMKLCTLKIAEPHRRQRYGALLVKAALDNAVTRDLSGLYVTVFDKHTELIGLLLDLGFELEPAVTALGELVLWRPLVPPSGVEAQLDGFEFNRRYGPRNLKLDVPMHIVPIEPRWEERLFPEGRVQLDLLPENAACGNDLRKAYLSHSGSRQLARGDIVLFYRSGDLRAIRFIAVVEDTMRTCDSGELVSFVGTRTVYTANEIEELTRDGRKEVAAMLIRQSRFLDPGWPIADMIARGIVLQAPQSTQSVPEKGAAWVRSMLSA